MNNGIRLLISLIVVVFSLVYLFTVAIPNVQRANEEVRISQEAVDQAQLEVDQAIDDLNTSLNELNG